MALLPRLGVGVWALVASILAPTDLSLGLAMFNNPRVPNRVRREINVESGLNDGIAAPLVTLFIGIAIADASRSSTPFEEALKEIVLGVAMGVVVGVVGKLLRVSRRASWSSSGSRQFVAVALAALAYGSATLLHGNGFIASFVGGLAFGALARETASEAAEYAEETGTLLTLAVWFIFGAVIVPILVGAGLQWRPIVYALLSLTVIRMLPVAASLLGKKMHRSTVLFIGWFGPRGLASVVFLALALESFEGTGLDSTLLVATVGWTILLSVVLHGLSAGPVADWYSKKAASFPPDSPELGSATKARRARPRGAVFPNAPLTMGSPESRQGSGGSRWEWSCMRHMK